MTMTLVRQVLCTGVLCYLCMIMGVTFTWPSSTMTLFESVNTTLHRPMTETEIALFGSLSSIGVVIATPAAGFLLDVVGRKCCVTIFSIMHVIAWTMIIASNRVEVLLTAMFISGVGGAAILVVPVYIGEVCQASIRGGMASGSLIFSTGGMIISYAIGGYMDYHTMLYVCLSIAVGGVVLLGLLKESPMFLLKRGRPKEAAKAMAFYRAAKVDSKIVLQEMATIRRILNSSVEDAPEIPEEEHQLQPVKSAQKLSIVQFFKQSYSTRRAFFVVMVLLAASIFQGLPVVQVFAVPLFSEAIPNMSATLSSILLSIVAVIAGFVGAYLIDVVGRKPLMLYSSVASGVCCVLLGSQIHVHWGPHAVTAVIIYLFCAVQTLGAGTIPFILGPEVFLPEIKGIISIVVVEWIWVCNFILLFIFNPLIRAIGLGPVFYIFAVVCFATAVFTHFYLPETKGLPVDVIQTLFSKKKHRVPGHV